MPEYLIAATLLVLIIVVFYKVVVSTYDKEEKLLFGDGFIEEYDLDNVGTEGQTSEKD